MLLRVALKLEEFLVMAQAQGAPWAPPLLKRVAAFTRKRVQKTAQETRRSA